MAADERTKREVLRRSYRRVAVAAAAATTTTNSTTSNTTLVSLPYHSTSERERDRVSQRWRQESDREKTEGASGRGEGAPEVEREPSFVHAYPDDDRNFAPGHAPPRGTRPSTGCVPHHGRWTRDGTSHGRANRSDSPRGAVRRSPTLAESPADVCR